MSTDEQMLWLPVMAGIVGMAVAALLLAVVQTWWQRRHQDAQPVELRPHAVLEPRSHVSTPNAGHYDWARHGD